ncbi:hypothetical protein [Actinoplanes nipponensis]|uniref:hypothetical protein n=1 Tax=Actinoplanes nipponensis TaxID=135950 RepID=UPI0031EF5E92
MASGDECRPTIQPTTASPADRSAPLAAATASCGVARGARSCGCPARSGSGAYQAPEDNWATSPGRLVVSSHRLEW